VQDSIQQNVKMNDIKVDGSTVRLQNRLSVQAMSLRPEAGVWVPVLASALPVTRLAPPRAGARTK
jgi:hypothetical protein